MRYHVTIRSRAYVIEVEGGSVTVDGEKFEAHAAAIPGTPLIHLLLGKDSWTVAYQQLDERRWALGAAGERGEVEVQDDRGRWYLMRIRPSKTRAHRIDAVVVTWSEVDPSRAALVPTADGYGDAMLERLRDPAAILTSKRTSSVAGGWWTRLTNRSVASRAALRRSSAASISRRSRRM